MRVLYRYTLPQKESRRRRKNISKIGEIFILNMRKSIIKNVFQNADRLRATATDSAVTVSGRAARGDCLTENYVPYQNYVPHDDKGG